MDADFEWDSAKNALNQRKHRVRFEEAVTVFLDPRAKIFDDPDHSQHELREIIVGGSALGRLLVVSFTERGNRVRLISARRATKHEREAYEKTVT